MASCKQDATDSIASLERTHRGFPFKQTHKTDNEPGTVGDVVYFDFKVIAADSILYDTEVTKRAQQFRILPEDQITQTANPLIDLLAMSAVGDEMTLYYPMDSLPQKPEGFEDEEYIRYDVIIRHILRKETPGSASGRYDDVVALVNADRAAFESGTSDAMDLGNGLKMIIHEKGTGPVTKNGDLVEVHYYGALQSDGSMFDNSFQRDMGFAFPVGQGQVIQGWDRGLVGIERGSKLSLLIPSDLGYGARGNGPSIPGNSDLIFYVELKDTAK